MGENFKMSKIFELLCTVCCVCALLTNSAAETTKGILSSGRNGIELLFSLLGTMTLWSGLLEILSETGDVQRLGRLLRRVLAPLFPGLKDEKCWSAMGLNLSANLLGLGNAATPAGVHTAELLCQQGETGLRALAMLLVLNNAGLQLLPTTVMGMRSAAGAANPADIWLPTLAASGGATVCGCLLMSLIARGGGKHG